MQDEIPALKAAAEQKRGVLVKKALQSGHIKNGNVEKAVRFVFARPGVGSVKLGHQQANVGEVSAVLLGI